MITVGFLIAYNDLMLDKFHASALQENDALEICEFNQIDFTWTLNLNDARRPK